tara:strand:+ start:758 stop:913 length:156 start_codon:yes stop_codon:yes gene_type:complete
MIEVSWSPDYSTYGFLAGLAFCVLLGLIVVGCRWFEQHRDDDFITGENDES